MRRTDMSAYLVEELTDTFEENLNIPFRAFVYASSPAEAFQVVQVAHPERYWAFAPEELTEVVKDYLWQAADGSMVMYEVRSLVNVPVTPATSATRNLQEN
jgi:hypothetical protein